MVFSSPLFLFAFGPIFFLGYFLAPSSSRNGVAIVASLFFYAWGAPRFVFVLLAATALDYLAGRAIFRLRDEPGRQKLVLAASVLSNLLLLGYFKYASFFVGELNAFLAAAGFTPFSWTEIALPVGISFVVFHKVSYVVDVFRGVVPPAETFGRFLLYILLFPQLIAGPIIRYHEIADQLGDRRHDFENAFLGLVRFAVGLGKKVLVADPLGQVADAVFGLAPEQLSPADAWLGVLAYTFQIYFDFSGYSDMAIGLARVMGFRFPENFDRPYLAQTITEFWRRWHMSLSRWMREYLYVPLGGNRVAEWKVYRNLWIVFLLSGLWHGAQWNFVVWGLYHGIFLSFDKMGWQRVAQRLPAAVNRLVTFAIVVVGWVFFRADSLAEAVWVLTRMAGLRGPAELEYSVLEHVLTRRAAVVLAVAAVLSFVPERPRLRSWLETTDGDSLDADAAIYPMLPMLARFAIAITLLLLSSMALANSQFHPFIYFRF